MIIAVKGLNGGADVSGFMDRGAKFTIEASVGRRMDICNFTLMDSIPPVLSIPDRAEMVIYDLPSIHYTGFGTDVGAGSLADFATDAGSPSLAANIVTLPDGARIRYTAPYQPLAPTWQQYEGCARVNVAATGGLARFYLRWTDASNWARVVYTAGPTGTISYQKSVAGVVTTPGVSAALNVPAGSWWWIRFLVTTYGLLACSITPDVTPGGTFKNPDGTTPAITLVQGVEPELASGAALGAGTFALEASGAAVQVGGPFPRVLTVDTSVIDPPTALSAYNTWVQAVGSEAYDALPARWTPRMFAGYIADPEYSMEGAQRYVKISAQDYTMRLRTTIANQAFPSQMSDAAIIQALFARYRPDVDTSQVQVVVPNMPSISFPVHSLEQLLERIVKISRAQYRVDYYKRMTYGIAGGTAAPFNVSQFPDPGFARLTSQINTSDVVSSLSVTAIPAALSNPAAPQPAQFVQVGKPGDVTRLAAAGAAAGATSVPVVTFTATRTYPVGTPVYLNWVGAEQMQYSPAGSGFFNRVWIVGGQFLSVSQVYPVSSSLIDGVHYQYALPGQPEASSLLNVTVGATTYWGPGDPGVIAGTHTQGVGIAPGDGDLSDSANRGNWKFPALVQVNPPVLGLQATPVGGTAVALTTRFRYPLVQIVTDVTLVAVANGVIFESIIRDRRITSIELAVAIGQAYLKNQGATMKGGHLTLKYRSGSLDPLVAGLLQCGQQFLMVTPTLFSGLLAGGVGSFVVTRLSTELESDVNQPYVLHLDFADRVLSGGY